MNIPRIEDVTINNSTLPCDRLSLDDYPFADSGADLIEAERSTPVVVTTDTSVRPKILDKCGMACFFCHNEGTPVAQAFNGSISSPNPRYRQGRVSVFADNNGVDFLPGQMEPNEDFRSALRMLRETINSDDLHLTGGEPSLHPRLAALIALATEEGYGVKMTSNGENVSASIEECAIAGLKKVNFSIFGTTAAELAEVQNGKFKTTPHLAEAKISSLKRSIAACIGNGVEADANIVVSNETHIARVQRLIDTYDARLSVRLLNDIDAGEGSYFAIYSLLARLDARPVETLVEAGSSNARVKYALPDGRELYFKQIRKTNLPEICDTCPLNNENDCKEGYYGVRLYVGLDNAYRVGVCLQRMDLTLDVASFASSSLPAAIRALRSSEQRLLNKRFGDRVVKTDSVVMAND